MHQPLPLPSSRAKCWAKVKLGISWHWYIGRLVKDSAPLTVASLCVAQTTRKRRERTCTIALFLYHYFRAVILADCAIFTQKWWISLGWTECSTECRKVHVMRKQSDWHTLSLLCFPLSREAFTSLQKACVGKWPIAFGHDGWHRSAAAAAAAAAVLVDLIYSSWQYGTVANAQLFDLTAFLANGNWKSLPLTDWHEHVEEKCFEHSALSVQINFYCCSLLCAASKLPVKAPLPRCPTTLLFLWLNRSGLHKLDAIIFIRAWRWFSL